MQIANQQPKYSNLLIIWLMIAGNVGKKVVYHNFFHDIASILYERSRLSLVVKLGMLYNHICICISNMFLAGNVTTQKNLNRKNYFFEQIQLSLFRKYLIKIIRYLKLFSSNGPFRYFPHIYAHVDHVTMNYQNPD